MTSSSSIDQGLLAITKTGWMLKALGRSVYDSVKPWSCELYPGHFGGSYFHGTPKIEAWTIYMSPMATVIGEGATAIEAIHDALHKLDKSDAREVYDDLTRAFEDRLDAAS